MRQKEKWKFIRSQVTHVRRLATPANQVQLPTGQRTHPPLPHQARSTLPRPQKTSMLAHHGTSRFPQPPQSQHLLRIRTQINRTASTRNALLSPSTLSDPSRHQTLKHPLRPQNKKNQTHRLRHLQETLQKR